MATAACCIGRTIRPRRRVVRTGHHRISVGELGGRSRLPERPVSVTVGVAASERGWIVGGLRNKSPAARSHCGQWAVESHFGWQRPKVAGRGELSWNAVTFLAFHSHAYRVRHKVLLVSTNPASRSDGVSKDIPWRGACEGVARGRREIAVTRVAGFRRSGCVGNIHMTARVHAGHVCNGSACVR